MHPRKASDIVGAIPTWLTGLVLTDLDLISGVIVSTQFVPLNAGLIDEGQFLQDLNLELKELQESICKFRRQYGEKAKGAKAKLTVEIGIEIEDVDDDAYSVKTTMKATHPKRPASLSIAMGGSDDDGKMALFVRRSGSDDEHPRQMKLATRDGRIVDPETGRILD